MPSVFGTSATTLAERLASSTAGLMNMTLPVKVRPGTASVVNSSRWPTRTAGQVRGRHRAPSDRAAGCRRCGTSGRCRPCSRRDRRRSRRAGRRRRPSGRVMYDLAEPRLAGAHLRPRGVRRRLGRLERRRGVVESLRRDEAVLASAASARSCSRCARASPTRACASTAFSASMPASVSVVSSRASRAPFRTGTHSVT